MLDTKPTLEAYGDLQKYYDMMNVELFGGKLPNCLITYQRGASFMAYYSPKRFKKGEQVTDEIAINPIAFLSHDKTQILQTLLHEMTHLQQHYFGTPSRGGYHNKEWAMMMKNVGLMPFGVGEENYGKETGQKMNDRIIEGGVFEKFLNSDKDKFEIWVDSVCSIAVSETLSLEETPPPKLKPKNLLQEKINNAVESLEDHPSLNNPSEEALDYLDGQKAYINDVITEADIDISELSKLSGGKVKYSCDCSNVWSKAGLQSICLNCKKVFIYSK